MTTDRNSDGVELLPCPFCGEGANIGAWKQAVERHPDATAIECSNGLADCEPNPSVCCYSRDEAIAAWNRRASPSAAEVLALVESLIEESANPDQFSAQLLRGIRIGRRQAAEELAKLIPRGTP